MNPSGTANSLASSVTVLPVVRNRSMTASWIGWRLVSAFAGRRLVGSIALLRLGRIGPAVASRSQARGATASGLPLGNGDAATRLRRRNRPQPIRTFRSSVTRPAICRECAGDDLLLVELALGLGQRRLAQAAAFLGVAGQV